jgi:hypothetical protein
MRRTARFAAYMICDCQACRISARQVSAFVGERSLTLRDAKEAALTKIGRLTVCVKPSDFQSDLMVQCMRAKLQKWERTTLMSGSSASAKAKLELVLAMPA